MLLMCSSVTSLAMCHPAIPTAAEEMRVPYSTVIINPIGFVTRSSPLVSINKFMFIVKERL